MVIILAIEQETRDAAPSDFTASLLDQEARAVWQYQQDGFIRQIFFRDDQDAAILIVEAASVEQAEARLRKLPLVDSGLVSFELIALKAYPGFARLFKESAPE